MQERKGVEKEMKSIEVSEDEFVTLLDAFSLSASGSRIRKMAVLYQRLGNKHIEKKKELKE